MYLAQHDDKGRVFAQEISQAYNIPINHLTKIVHKLSQLGYINSYRGRNGGLTLGKAKEDINIRQVIEDFEPSLTPADCENCVIKTHCELQVCLNEASEAFLASLEKKSLADMIRK